MQIQPNSSSNFTSPMHHNVAGRQDQKGHEGVKPAGERIILTHTGEQDMPRVHDVAKARDNGGMGKLDKLQGQGLQAPQGEVDKPNIGEVRKHLAEIDRSMRKRLFGMAQDQGLDKASAKALASEFHQSVKSAFEAFKAGDIPDKQALMLEIRGAFQAMKEGFHAQVSPQTAPTAGTPSTSNIATTTASSSTTSGNVTATQSPAATPGTPGVDPVGGSETGSGTTSTTTGNVTATQSPATTAPAPIVDPFVGTGEVGVVDTALRDEPNGAVASAMESLVERFESAVARLEELFEQSETHERFHGFYDAAGFREAQQLIGDRFDATA